MKRAMTCGHRVGAACVVATLFVVSALVLGGCAKQKPCVDKSKPALADCQTRVETLQRSVNDLKVKYALAQQNTGIIKLDASFLELNGQQGKKKRRLMVKEGSLNKVELLKVIKAGRGALEACYNRALKRNTALHHSKLTLTLDFKVRSNGNPAGISLSPNRDAKMVDCMKKAIRRWRFSRFQGQPVSVVSPVTLRPTG